MTFLSCYGQTIGPLGFPMTDQEAKSLDDLLDGLPEVDYRHLAVKQALTEVAAGERADVSWISTEAVDHDREVVLASGMDDSHFRNNPIVTLGHDYDRPPIGRSVWRRRVRQGATRGIKARTVYPPRPDEWDDELPWPPDHAFALVQAGLLRGKSIGFLALESRPPTEEEVREHPAWASVRRIVVKWLLLEYACTWLPVNPEAVTETVGKSAATLGLELPPPRVIPFTSVEEIEKHVRRQLGALDPAALAGRAVEQGLARLTGQV